MSFHSDTLSRFRANQFFLFLLNAVCIAEKQQISTLQSLVWPDLLHSSMLTIAPPMRFYTIGPHQPVKRTTIQMAPKSQLNEILNFTIGPQQLASKMKYYNILVKWNTVQLK